MPAASLKRIPQTAAIEFGTTGITRLEMTSPGVLGAVATEWKRP